MQEELDRAWDREWGDTPPIGHLLRAAQRDRWVRFHALPESKRYPDSEEEYGIVLARHHALLDALGLSGRCFALAMRFTNDLMPPENPGLPEAILWRTVAVDEEEDLDAFIYGAEMSFPSAKIDDLLRAVADEKEVGVILLPSDGAWLYCPYDGGADVIAPSPAVRDELARQFSEWLSAHPTGV